MKGRNVGIDLEKRSMTVCFMDENQTQLELLTFGTVESQREKLFTCLNKNDTIGIEAGSQTFTILRRKLRKKLYACASTSAYARKILNNWRKKQKRFFLEIAMCRIYSRFPG